MLDAIVFLCFLKKKTDKINIKLIFTLKLKHIFLLARDLGILVSSSLTWKEHCLNIVRKTSFVV